MTIKECYSIIHGNYEQAKERFRTDDRIKRFLLIFLNDEHYEGLCEAMGKGNYEDAFLNSHTLKGMCASLSMTVLYEEFRVLTELLRERKGCKEADDCFEGLRELYDLTVKTIAQLRSDE